MGRPVSFVHANVQSVVAARDALATPRVLASSVEASAGADVALALLCSWPQCRLSWAGPSELGEAERWLADGIELLDPTDVSWLADRLFHYDVVLWDDAAPAKLREWVARTQPQATTIAQPELFEGAAIAPGRMTELFAGAGIAPGSGSRF
jgi:hypothetical protein